MLIIITAFISRCSCLAEGGEKRALSSAEGIGKWR